MGAIDFNKVVEYSKNHCEQESIGLCATYVKKAFVAGGCKYVSGDGWNNQEFCETNDFVCIGDFVPIDNNPRPHDGMPIQFPEGYVQQLGDICLIQHGNEYGHICYAMGSSIDDWVSDYFQVPPAQQAGTGPYCYASGITRVQFWRHSSVLNDAPVVEVETDSIDEDEVYDNSDKYLYEYTDDELKNIGGKKFKYDDWIYEIKPGFISFEKEAGFLFLKYSNDDYEFGIPLNAKLYKEQTTNQESSNNNIELTNNVNNLSSATKQNDIEKNDNILCRIDTFEKLRNKLTKDAPGMGRDINYTKELIDSNILKGDQEARKTLC